MFPSHMTNQIAHDRAREAAETLARKAIENDDAREGTYRFLTTGDPELFREMGRRFPTLHVRSWAEAGDPAERLVAVAESERVDTIVLGNRGTHGSWWRVRDSVPNIVLRHAPCSVMIVDTRAAQ